MKETTKTTTYKYDDKGNIIEKTETVVEKVYSDYTYIPAYPITSYPFGTICTTDTPPINNYTITCDSDSCKLSSSEIESMLNNSIKCR